jgi:hypothetical protein
LAVNIYFSKLLPKISAWPEEGYFELRVGWRFLPWLECAARQKTLNSIGQCVKAEWARDFFLVGGELLLVFPTVVR